MLLCRLDGDFARGRNVDGSSHVVRLSWIGVGVATFWSRAIWIDCGGHGEGPRGIGRRVHLSSSGLSASNQL